MDKQEAVAKKKQ